VDYIMDFGIVSFIMEKSMEMSQMDSARSFDLDTELDFGQHQGLTIEEIYVRDAQYLIWMYENFEDTEWSDDVETLVTQAMDAEVSTGFEAHGSEWYSYFGD